MATQEEQTKLQSLDERMGRMEVRMDDVVVPALADIKAKLNADTYATKGEVDKVVTRVENLEKVTRNTPLVERLAFGLVAIVLIAVLGALIALVVVTGHK